MVPISNLIQGFVAAPVRCIQPFITRVEKIIVPSSGPNIQLSQVHSAEFECGKIFVYIILLMFIQAYASDDAIMKKAVIVYDG